MSLLTEWLEKNGISYVRKDVQKYEGSSSRVNVPKEWDGTVIVVRESINYTKVLDGLREELAHTILACAKMRELSKESKTPCTSVTEPLWQRAKRDNDVCKRCQFGKRITETLEAITSLYDDKDSEKIKLAEQFFERMEDIDAT